MKSTHCDDSSTSGAAADQTEAEQGRAEQRESCWFRDGGTADIDILATRYRGGRRSPRGRQEIQGVAVG